MYGRTHNHYTDTGIYGVYSICMEIAPNGNIYSNKAYMLNLKQVRMHSL